MSSLPALKLLIYQSVVFQVNFRINRVVTESGSRQKISPVLEGGDSCNEKSALESPAGDDDTIGREVDDQREDTGEVGEAAVGENLEKIADKIAKCAPEQTRPLPFVDETAEEEEQE